MIRALAVAVLAAACPALALNPESTPVSAEAALTAGTVLAADDVGGGGWYNPAALAGVTRKSIQVGASAYAVSLMHVDSATSADLPWAATREPLNSGNYMSVPSVLSYSFRLREGLGLSIGVWTPYHEYAGGSVTADSTGPYPNAPGITGTYNQILTFSDRRDDTWGGVGIGWQARPGLRLGAMLQGSYSTHVWTKDFNAALATDSPDPLEQGSHLDLSERGDLSYLGLRSLLGLQWDATSELRLAVAARTPVLRVISWGSTSRVLSAAVLLPGAPVSEYRIVQSEPAAQGVTVIEPLRLYAGLQFARDGWTASAEVDWHPALDSQYAEYRAAWNARVGATWHRTDDLQLGIGFFRDASGAVRQAEAASVITYGLAGGAQYRPAAVLKALGGGTDWDMLAGVAVRASYGTGTVPGLQHMPIDAQGIPIAVTAPVTPALTTVDSSAWIFEGSISFFTTIMF